VPSQAQAVTEESYTIAHRLGLWLLQQH